MRLRSLFSPERREIGAWFAVLALAMCGCGGGGDYYFLNEIRGEGDTVLLEFVYTCGLVDVTWDGAFGTLPHFQADLAVKHDALGGDCGEDPREYSFDIGPMKRSFRSVHPWPTPLGLRVPPYEEEQGAICLPNLFQTDVFRGRRCK